MTPAPLTLALASGKGGVGKSVLAVNLAETLARRGLRVALVDADAGQSACPVLLNEAPAATAACVAQGRASLAEAFAPTAGGLTLFQAATEPPDEGDPGFFDALDRGLARLRTGHDVILIDAPAGAGPLVRWALDRAGAGLLVLVGEPTAVADAYALAKLVWTAAPHFPLGVIVNHADTEAEAQDVAARFAAVTGPFLGQAPAFLGWVPYTVAVRASVRAQAPAVRTEGAARAAFDVLAARVAEGSWAGHAAPVP